MALAKFYEDLVESYLEGADSRVNASYGRDLETEWKQKQATVSDAVTLRGADGVLWDDYLVFLTGKPIPFKIDSARAGATVHIRWQSLGDGTVASIREHGASMQLAASQAFSGDLIVSSGNYSKTYRVSFVAGSRPEALPDFAAELAALTANPPTWTQSSFDRFRVSTEAVLQSHKLPADFCDGIREYHLGLYHEQMREARFGERLDRAYAQLVPFAPFSRLATLVCGYHLYRINAFDAPLARTALTRIGRVARFFSGETTPVPSASESANASPLETLIISALDEALIAAVEHLDGGRPDLAAADVAKADAARCGIDTQALERIYFLRHEICGRQRDARGATQYATQLCNSAVPSFRALAAPKGTLLEKSVS
jgi:hypothetical protein